MAKTINMFENQREAWHFVVNGLRAWVPESANLVLEELHRYIDTMEDAADENQRRIEELEEQYEEALVLKNEYTRKYENCIDSIEWLWNLIDKKNEELIRLTGEVNI